MVQNNYAAFLVASGCDRRGRTFRVHPSMTKVVVESKFVCRIVRVVRNRTVGRWFGQGRQGGPDGNPRKKADLGGEPRRRVRLIRRKADSTSCSSKSPHNEHP